MEWNYRVIAFMDEDAPYFRIHEVYYDQNGKPAAYMRCPAGVESESPEGLMWVMERMKKALELPVLKITDFPEPSDGKPMLLPPPGYSNWLDYVVANTSVPRDINIQTLFDPTPWGRELSRDEVRAAIDVELAMLRPPN